MEGVGRDMDKKLSSWSGSQLPHQRDGTCSFEVSEAGMIEDHLGFRKIPMEQ